MTRAIFRTEILVDDAWHDIALTGPMVHVAARTPYTVEIWHIADDAQPSTFHSLRVFGTGQDLPEEASSYLGAAVVPGGRLVWHLMERATGGSD